MKTALFLFVASIMVLQCPRFPKLNPFSCASSARVLATNDTVIVGFWYHGSEPDSLDFPIALLNNEALGDTLEISAWLTGKNEAGSDNCGKDFEWSNDTLFIQFGFENNMGRRDSLSTSGRVLSKSTSVPLEYPETHVDSITVASSHGVTVIVAKPK